MESEAKLPKWAAKPCIMGIDEAGRGPVLGITSPLTFPLSAIPNSIESSGGISCATCRAYGVRMLVLRSFLPEDSLHAQLRRFFRFIPALFWTLICLLSGIDQRARRLGKLTSVDT